MIETVTEPIVNPWLLPSVADAQLALVRQQLAEDVAGNPPAPFAAFERAMRFVNNHVLDNAQKLYAIDVPKSKIPFVYIDRPLELSKAGSTISLDVSLLDVGCGVGHYGILCERFGGIHYWGTDVSEAMITRAIFLLNSQTVPDWERNPFSVCQLENNRFDEYDIVFISQALEMTDDPLASLRLVLERSKKYVLLHRLRVPPMTEPSRRVIERTYLGHTAPNMEWNSAELEGIAREYGEIIYSDEWDMSLTMIVEKK